MRKHKSYKKAELITTKNVEIHLHTPRERERVRGEGGREMENVRIKRQKKTLLGNRPRHGQKK